MTIGIIFMRASLADLRMGHAGAVALDLSRGAAALVTRVAKIAAGTGIHRGDQHEIARQGHLAGAARD